ncbi:MAG: cysteine hydrolase [Betaproteobacteria bacterium]|nr:cysteine hydrolase [Betaproteobacteria bacterium]
MISQLSLAAEPRDLCLDFEHTALVLVDLQGAFLNSDPEQMTFANSHLGFDPSKGGVEHAVGILPILQNLTAVCRQAQMKIVHLAEQYSDWEEIPWKWQQGVIGEPDTQTVIHLRRDSDEAALSWIPPLPGELVVPKNGKNGFKMLDLVDGQPISRLTYLLRHQLGVHHLLFTGVATSVCVGSTAMSATEYGFDSILVADACGDFFPHRHHATLEMFGAGRVQKMDLYGSVTTSQAIIKALG